MATMKYTNLAEVKVFIEQLPNGEFRWVVSKMDGTEIDSECEVSVGDCLTFAAFAMREAMVEISDQVLHPEWFDGSLSDGAEAFEGIE
jgi:hypothetical protein